jgi:hypothetical protein
MGSAVVRRVREPLVTVQHDDQTGANGRPDRKRPVAVVTDAQRSRVEELRERERRYLWTMAFRTAFFIAAILIFVYVSHIVGIIAGILSMILPWIAVVAANAGPHRPNRPQRYIPGPGSELGSGDSRRR